MHCHFDVRSPMSVQPMWHWFENRAIGMDPPPGRPWETRRKATEQARFGIGDVYFCAISWGKLDAGLRFGAFQSHGGTPKWTVSNICNGHSHWNGWFGGYQLTKPLCCTILGWSGQKMQSHLEAKYGCGTCRRYYDGGFNDGPKMKQIKCSCCRSCSYLEVEGSTGILENKAES